MGKGSGLEELRQALADKRQHIALGRITKIGLADNRTCLRVQVSIFPEEREVVAIMTWESTGPECGWFDLPAVGDLVLVAFVEGDPDQAFVIKRLTSLEDKIPLKASQGHIQLRSKAGKKVYVESDTEASIRAEKVQLVRDGTESASENIVLGQVFKQFATDLLTYLAAHQHVSNIPGLLTSPPANPGGAGDAASFTALAASPIGDEAILSDVSFTEKG